jgi:hypothetical protein
MPQGLFVKPYQEIETLKNEIPDASSVKYLHYSQFSKCIVTIYPEVFLHSLTLLGK